MGRKTAAEKLKITLKDGSVFYQGQGGPVANARATVETSGAVHRRITATRLVLLGPFALAAKKAQDERKLFLVVEGQGFSLLVDLEPGQEALARTVAAEINVQGQQAQGTTNPPPNWYPSPDGSPTHTWWDGQKWTAHIKF